MIIQHAEKVLPGGGKLGFFQIRRFREPGVPAFLNDHEMLFSEQEPESIFGWLEGRLGGGHKSHVLLSISGQAVAPSIAGW
jgi:hypothetical protein